MNNLQKYTLFPLKTQTKKKKKKKTKLTTEFLELEMTLGILGQFLSVKHFAKYFII